MTVHFKKTDTKNEVIAEGHRMYVRNGGNLASTFADELEEWKVERVAAQTLKGSFLGLFLPGLDGIIEDQAEDARVLNEVLGGS